MKEKNRNNPYLISVIIPTWNRKDDLINAINSVLNQSYKNIEILVCDDGSTDGSKKAVKLLNDKRIRWIPGVRKGLPAAPRNNGIRNAKGDFLAFLDSDDIWLPDKLSSQIEIYSINKNLNFILTSNAILLKSNLHLQTDNFFKSIHQSNFSLENLLYDNKVITSSVMLHKSIQKKIGFFPESKNLRAYEDYAYWLRAATVGKFWYSPLPKIIYTMDSQTSIRKDENNYQLKKTYILLNYYNWLLMKYPIRFPYIFYTTIVMVCLNIRKILVDKKLYIKNFIKNLFELITYILLNLLSYIFIFNYYLTTKSLKFYNFLKHVYGRLFSRN